MEKSVGEPRDWEYGDKQQQDGEERKEDGYKNNAGRKRWVCNNTESKSGQGATKKSATGIR